ncbi:hypothetical protein, partial [Limosilactobacillus ingluviei]|uniref:hypothetical protein n=1 Tax=Limosilactobacillus ingluviei TaxID=148604 RepID=UPI0023F1164F
GTNRILLPSVPNIVEPFFSSDASLWGGEPGLSSAWPVAVVARKRMTNVKHSHPLASLIKLVGCL